MLDGPLDADALRAAVDRLAAAEPALRMRLVAEGRGHVLTSATTSAVRLRVLDAAEAEAWLSSPLDVLGDPLLRWALVRESPRRHRLVLADHHLVLDGWSVPRVVDRLFAHYRAELARGDAPPGPSAWRGGLADLVLTRTGSARPAAQAAEEWERVLPVAAGGALVPAAEGEHVAAEAAISADLALAASTHGLSAAEAVSLAWLSVLAALSGRSRVVGGQVVSGRSEASTDTIGMLLGTVPIAAALDAPTLTDTVGSLSATTRLAQTVVDAPLTRLARARGEAVLFDTLLVVENYPSPAGADLAPGVHLVEVSGEDDTHYPLCLTVELAPTRREAEGDRALASGSGPGSVAAASVTGHSVPGASRHTVGSLRLDHASGLFSTEAARSVLAAVDAAVSALARSSAGTDPAVLVDAASAALTAEAQRALDGERGGPGGTAPDGAAPRVAAEPAPGALDAVLDAMTETMGLSVRPTEDFFSLGGDSLTAIALVTAVRSRGWELTPAIVFGHPTAERMAAQLRPLAAEPATPPAPADPGIRLDDAGAQALGALLAGIEGLGGLSDLSGFGSSGGTTTNDDNDGGTP